MCGYEGTVFCKNGASHIFQMLQENEKSTFICDVFQRKISPSKLIFWTMTVYQNVGSGYFHIVL